MGRRQVGVDPVVLAVVTDGDEKRKKNGKRRKPRADERQQTNLRLASEVADIIKMLAHHERTTPAGVADLLIAAGLRQYLDGQVDFDQYIEESRSPRWDWVVRVDELPALVRELEEKLL